MIPAVIDQCYGRRIPGLPIDRQARGHRSLTLLADNYVIVARTKPIAHLEGSPIARDARLYVPPVGFAAPPQPRFDHPPVQPTRPSRIPGPADAPGLRTPPLDTRCTHLNATLETQ